MDEFPFSALFLFAQSCLTDAVNVIFSDYCFTDTYLKDWRAILFDFFFSTGYNREKRL